MSALKAMKADTAAQKTYVDKQEKKLIKVSKEGWHDLSSVKLEQCNHHKARDRNFCIINPFNLKIKLNLFKYPCRYVNQTNSFVSYKHLTIVFKQIPTLLSSTRIISFSSQYISPKTLASSVVCPYSFEEYWIISTPSYKGSDLCLFIYLTILLHKYEIKNQKGANEVFAANYEFQIPILILEPDVLDIWYLDLLDQIV